MRPIVALLTDFGARDFYAGAIRGAVLAARPGAAVVDVTRAVPPHDVAEGAWTRLGAGLGETVRLRRASAGGGR